MIIMIIIIIFFLNRFSLKFWINRSGTQKWYVWKGSHWINSGEFFYHFGEDRNIILIS